MYHAAFGRGDESRLAGGAVDEDREVKLTVDVSAILNVEAVDLLAVLVGLRGDEVVAEHRLGVLDGLFLGEGEANAALLTCSRLHKLALAAATRMDLAFHDPERSGQLVDRLFHIVDRKHGRAVSNGRTIGLQHGLGLVFMDVHGEIQPLVYRRRDGDARDATRSETRGLITLTFHGATRWVRMVDPKRR